MMESNNKMIFDLGFHNGDDTNFYLSKGFKVVAVEANPKLVEQGQTRFENAISSGKLELVNKALFDKSNKQQKFYINKRSSNVSSLYKKIAESDGTKSRSIYVTTTNLNELFEQFGIPFYMKTDVEGADVHVANSLIEAKAKPKYVSFELSRTFFLEIFSALNLAGYKKFQLVNQLANPTRKNGDFGDHSSGPFGPYLPKNKWIQFDDALARYLKFKELRDIDAEELALGWLDLHAKL